MLRARVTAQREQCRLARRTRLRARARQGSTRAILPHKQMLQSASLGGKPSNDINSPPAGLCLARAVIAARSLCCMAFSPVLLIALTSTKAIMLSGREPSLVAQSAVHESTAISAARAAVPTRRLRPRHCC